MTKEYYMPGYVDKTPPKEYPPHIARFLDYIDTIGDFDKGGGIDKDDFSPEIDMHNDIDMDFAPNNGGYAPNTSGFAPKTDSFRPNYDSFTPVNEYGGYKPSFDYGEYRPGNMDFGSYRP